MVRKYSVRPLNSLKMQYRSEREGLAYDVSLSKQELSTIGTFVLNNPPAIEVPRFPPRIRFAVHPSFPEFLERVRMLFTLAPSLPSVCRTSHPPTILMSPKPTNMRKMN